jgi:hypothetical protein
MTATDLAVRDPQASAISAKLAYARELANSGLLPAAYRKNPANVLWAMEYGDMLGLHTVAVVTGVHVIDGKPTASAGLISGLVRQAGHKLRVWGDGMSATCEITRSDDPRHPFTVTWTLKKAGDNPSAEEADLLGKSNWKKYPASMLKSRAITQCARDACEEILFGLAYTPEELGAEVDEDGVVVEDPPAAQSRGRGTVFIDPECLVEPGDPDYPDDLAWRDQAIERAAVLKSEHAGSKLWAESVEKVNAGELSRDDYDKIKELIGAQVEALRQQAFDKAMSALSENESWRAKLDELTSGDDADAALRELDEMTDKQRAGRIRHAITTLAILRRWNTTDTDREAA